MTDATPYTIVIDPARRYVEIAMFGLWDAATARAYDADLRARLRVLPANGCPLNEQVTLFDNRAFPVQTQEVIALLAAMAADRSIASRRIAILIEQSISILQARRVVPDYRIFADRQQALDWLFEPIAP